MNWGLWGNQKVLSESTEGGTRLVGSKFMGNKGIGIRGRDDLAHGGRGLWVLGKPEGGFPP